MGRRGFPKEMYDKKENNKLERGTCVFRRKGPITAVTWIDYEPVNVVCTLKVVSGEATKPVKRRKKDGEQQDVDCLLMISSYNKYMGSVDRNDQMKSYYAIKFRSRNGGIFDRCIVNGHILESESPNHEQRSLKDFRLELAKKLIRDFISRKRPGRPSLELAARFTERHFSSYLPTNEKGKVKERRCHVCSTKDKPKKTSYYCKDCGVGLCVAPCFRIHHTNQ